MNYNQLITNVCNRIRIQFPTSSQLEWIKNEIVNVTTEVLAITELLKTTETYNIEPEVRKIELPPDFYIPQEIIFFDSEGTVISAEEMPYEKFLKHYSDTKVAYALTYENSLSYLHWKPNFSGSIVVYYVRVPEILDVIFNSVPEVQSVFHNVIADGVALNYFKQSYADAKTQEEIFKYNNLISLYKEDFEKGKQRILSYTQRTSSTQRIENWDFLNDRDMIII